MADVSSYLHLRRRKLPFVERVVGGLEDTCRRYDQSIVRVIWLVLAVVAWMVVADSLVSKTTVRFDGEWDAAVSAKPVESQDRASGRTLYRVLRSLTEQCAKHEYRQSVVLGPQVRVNDKPYMYRVMRLCAQDIEFVNPVIAFRGEKEGVCIDEHMGIKRRSSRRYPVAVHSTDRAAHSFLELAEVCTFMHALSLLDAQWSA